MASGRELSVSHAPQSGRCKNAVAANGSLLEFLRIHPVGQLLPQDGSTEQPFQRPLYFETCQRAISHCSANAAGSEKSWSGPCCCLLLSVVDFPVVDNSLAGVCNNYRPKATLICGLSIGGCILKTSIGCSILEHRFLSLSVRPPCLNRLAALL
jgi:hypothetical protein